MNQRVSTKRKMANVLMGGAALLGIWAIAATVRTDEPRQVPSVVIAPAAMQEADQCLRSRRADDECFAVLLHVTDAALRLAPLRKTLEGEQVKHDARAA